MMHTRSVKHVEAHHSCLSFPSRALAEATDADSSAWIGEGLLLRARCEQARGQLESMRSSARAALPHLEQNLGAEHPLAVSARTLMGTAASSDS